MNSIKNRAKLSRLITLLESSIDSHRLEALREMDQMHLPSNSNIRVGISGPPGVGKSCFIEKLGLMKIAHDLSLAVLAIDPSSQIRGGSILGDKTRMEELSRSPLAYIRPSPSGGVHGGVNSSTWDTVSLCAAWGFDFTFIETVGVGQVATDIVNIVDCLVVLQNPYTGDELQGLKKGLLEHADIIVITKDDGENRGACLEMERHLTVAKGSSFRVVPPIYRVSNIDASGIDNVSEAISRIVKEKTVSGNLQKLRERQYIEMIEVTLKSLILRDIQNNSGFRELVSKESESFTGRLPSTLLAQEIFADLGGFLSSIAEYSLRHK